jgi:hypothetical protein
LDRASGHGFVQFVARMERSAMRDGRPGFHPGYVLRAA